MAKFCGDVYQSIQLKPGDFSAHQITKRQDSRLDEHWRAL